MLQQFWNLVAICHHQVSCKQYDFLHAWPAWDQYAQVKAILAFTIESVSLCFFVHYIYNIDAIVAKLDDVRAKNRNSLNSVIFSSIHYSRLFENTAWSDSLISPVILILWPLFLSCSVLSAKRLLCKTTWYLVLTKIFCVTTLPTKSQNISMLTNWFTVMM